MITANETNRNDIGFGARVKLNPAFGTGTKYFVCYLSNNHVLLADSKRDCKDEVGYIHSIHDIQAYQN